MGLFSVRLQAFVGKGKTLHCSSEDVCQMQRLCHEHLESGGQSLHELVLQPLVSSLGLRV